MVLLPLSSWLFESDDGDHHHHHEESDGDGGDFVDHTFIFLTGSPHLSRQNLGIEEGPGGVEGEDGRSTGPWDS